MGNVYIGTSGYAYKEWAKPHHVVRSTDSSTQPNGAEKLGSERSVEERRPSFYPEKTPEREFLSYYASKLRGVEIDYTFYRMPSAKTLTGWRDGTPAGFKFALKASQKITHFERLRLPSAAHDYLQGVVPTLGDRLGAMLYQLPPNFRCGVDRLETFLASRTSSTPAAFEFRHESWFTPEVYALLEKKGVGLVINDGDEGCTPLERTAPLVYLRLRRSGYSDEERECWRERIRDWARGGDVFAFIKHDNGLPGIEMALELTRSLAEDALVGAGAA
jgi:uncharacterized protein YecE (DUF72 family)